MAWTIFGKLDNNENVSFIGWRIEVLFEQQFSGFAGEGGTSTGSETIKSIVSTRPSVRVISVLNYQIRKLLQAIFFTSWC